MGKMPSFYGSRGKQKKPLVLSEWIEGHQAQKLILATERDLNVMFHSFSLPLLSSCMNVLANHDAPCHNFHEPMGHREWKIAEA